jgi:hypothetical protein
MQRKVCIEFVKQDTIKVTTFILQKEFKLTPIKNTDQGIDLITLKLFDMSLKSDVQLRAEIWQGTGELNDPFVITVLTRISENVWDEVIGNVCAKDGMKTFSVNIPDGKK